MSESSVYIGVFSSLTAVNTVKRMLNGTHLPMRNVPSCLRSRGCSYALDIREDLLDEVVRVVGTTCIEAEFFRVTMSDDGLKRYDPVGKRDDLS